MRGAGFTEFPKRQAPPGKGMMLQVVLVLNKKVGDSLAKGLASRPRRADAQLPPYPACGVTSSLVASSLTQMTAPRECEYGTGSLNL